MTFPANGAEEVMVVSVGGWLVRSSLNVHVLQPWMLHRRLRCAVYIKETCGRKRLVRGTGT